MTTESPQQDLTEITLSSETIAEGGMLLVKRDQVREIGRAHV